MSISLKTLYLCVVYVRNDYVLVYVLAHVFVFLFIYKLMITNKCIYLIIFKNTKIVNNIKIQVNIFKIIFNFN